jgi:hypothetical protein
VSKPTCADPGCEAAAHARGLCGRHYTKAWKAGALPPLPAQGPLYLEDPATGCWIWQGAPNSEGYGRLKVGGKRVYAHRWMYEQHRGLLPEGLTLDHLCRVRLCCNPAHLEAVTLAENKRRGESLNAKNARKGECVNGHPFTEANTYRRPDTGARQCRACKRVRDQRGAASMPRRSSK